MSVFGTTRTFLDFFQARYRFFVIYVIAFGTALAILSSATLFKNEKIVLIYVCAALVFGFIAGRDIVLGNGRAIFSRCRVFLSSPSASLQNDDARGRWTEDLARVRDALAEELGTSKIACPTLSYPIAADQERPTIALRENLDNIRDADYFVAVIPQWGVHSPTSAPTSSLIELGIAITYRKKVAIFLRSDLKLPYIIADVDGGLGRNLKPISVKRYTQIEDIITDIQKHQHDIFAYNPDGDDKV